jgi:hypothetical protein
VSGPISEAVTVRDPVLLDQHGETACSSEVRVEADLRQRGELRRAIPPVGAVDEYVRVREVDRSHDDEDALEDVGEMRKPVGPPQRSTVEVASRLGISQSCRKRRLESALYSRF